MVVDDDHGILEVIQIILEGENYDVLTLSSSEAIEDKIRTFSPDIILLDIWMSGQNGGEIAIKLKSDTNTSHIPIIMISAKNDTDVIAKQSKADDYISKPFDMDDLLNKIKKHIKNRHF